MSDKDFREIRNAEPTEIEVTAFTFSGTPDPIFHHALTGEVFEDALFEGYCMVYFKDGQLIFHTGITDVGDRYWWAIGNKPKISFHFA